MSELIKLENINAVAVFVDGGADDVLKSIKSACDEFLPDVSTAKGRKEIASMALKVAKSKTALDAAGKELVSDWKAKAKLVDDERKRIRETLDELKVSVRLPLTEFEDAEKQRVNNIENRIEVIKSFKSPFDSEMNDYTVEQLEDRINQLNMIPVDSSFDEYENDAMAAKTEAMDKLEIMIFKKRKLEEEKAAAKAEEEERIRLERIEYEAKIKAKAEEDNLAAIEAEKKKTEEAERLRIAAEERAKHEARQAEADRLQAEEQAKINAEKAAANARQAEIDRQEQEKLAEKQAQEKREANKKHIGAIRKAAKESLISQGLDEETAIKVVLAIHGGLIANVQINY